MQMAECISREAVMSKCNDIWDNADETTQTGVDTINTIDEITDFIESLPTADVQPVKHGWWLEHHAIWIDQPEIEGWFVEAKCSECESWANVMNPYTKSVDYERCPHCGARMDGDTRNLIDEETYIYNNRLEAEAKTIDEISLL